MNNLLTKDQANEKTRTVVKHDADNILKNVISEINEHINYGEFCYEYTSPNIHVAIELLKILQGYGYDCYINDTPLMNWKEDDREYEYDVKISWS